MKETQVNRQLGQILQKNVKIFELQVLNKQNRPKIIPLYAGFQELKLRCQKILQSDMQISKNNHTHSNQSFHPIVWVDCQNQSNKIHNQFSQQDENISMFDLFQQILVKSQDSLRNTDSQKDFKNNSEKSKFLNISSSQLIQKNKSQFKQSLNENLFITAKPLKVKVSQENDAIIQNVNIILIHLTLFTNQKQLSKLSDDLLSLGIYLSYHMVINLKSTKDSKEQLKKLAQCLREKVREIKKVKEDKNKYQVDMISCQQVELQNEQNQSLLKYHKVNFNKKGSIKSLLKLKNEIIQRLNFNSFRISGGNGNRLQSFMERLEVASRILSSTLKKSYFVRQDLFSQEKISEKQKQMMKQVDLGEQRLIREKFENFYNNLRFNSKKQLPLHNTVIKFKVEQFIRLELKEKVRNKKLLEKISDQYKIKIEEYNDRKIKKVVQESVKDYLSTKNNNTQVNQEIKFHPDKILRLINEYHKIVQSSYMFVTEGIFNQIAYPTIYNHYYQTLYERYKITKRQNDQNYQINQQKYLVINKELQDYKNKARQLQLQCEKQKHAHKLLKNQYNQVKTEKYRLQDQLIQWKQKANDTQKLLINQQSTGKALRDLVQQLQKRVTQLQTIKVEKILGLNNSQCIKMGKQLVNMQLLMNKQTQQSFKLTEQFQMQLDKYKQQYNRLETELKDKQKYLQEKQQYYKQKVSLLQSQLQLKNHDPLINTVKDQQNITQEIQRQLNSKIEQRELEHENKVTNYHQQIKQLQTIINCNHQNITYLNQQIYTLKKTIHSHQETIHNHSNTITKLSKQLHHQNQFISNKDFIIAQKQMFISQLTQQNILLNQKVNQKTNKLSILQQNLHTLTNKAHQQQNYNLQSHNLLNQNKIKHNSFLRFQTDNDPTILDQSVSINDITTKSIYSNNATPLKRSCSRVKTVTEIKQNMELQKLIQQRKTIQKRKQKCTQRQSILQDLHKNNSLLANSIIKQNSLLQQPFFSTQSTIFNKHQSKSIITKQQKHLPLKNNQEFNKALKNSSLSSKYDGLNNLKEQHLRKRLF